MGVQVDLSPKYLEFHQVSLGPDEQSLAGRVSREWLYHIEDIAVSPTHWHSFLQGRAGRGYVYSISMETGLPQLAMVFAYDPSAVKRKIKYVSLWRAFSEREFGFGFLYPEKDDFALDNLGVRYHSIQEAEAGAEEMLDKPRVATFVFMDKTGVLAAWERGFDGSIVRVAYENRRVTDVVVSA